MPYRLPRVVLLAAAAAMLVAATSATAQDVKINIGLGVPPIVLTAPPQLVVVPGTSVSYAPDVQANLFFYQGRYYTVANGVWARAPAYNGPWAVIQIGQVPPPVLAVPVEYYKIPPGQLKKHGPPSWAGQGYGKHPKKPKHK
jgi:WXXGXW repeat (2 copies)